MIGELLAAAVAHVNAIQGVDNPLGYAIPRVDIYDGQVNEAQLPELLARTPAVFVALAAARSTAETSSARRWDGRLQLLIVTTNLASANAARQGGKPGEVGAWQIAEQLAAAFDQRRLGLEIDPLAPMAITNLVPGWARTRKAAIVGLELTTGWDVPFAPEDPDALADFLRVHTDWSLGGPDAPEYSETTETRP